MYNYHIAEIGNYKESYLQRLIPERIIKISNDLVFGVINFGHENTERIEFNSSDLMNFDWNVKPQKSQNTFKLYLYGLRHVYLLAKAYDHTEFNKYIETADNFVTSFSKHYNDPSSNDEMIDNDHAISERIENLVYLYFVTKKHNFKLMREKELIDLIRGDIKKLLGDKYYQNNHNHGIIADKALLIGIYFLNDKDSKEKIGFVANRLKKQVEYAFFSDGIHKENSFGYQILVISMVLAASNVLNIIGNDYSKKLLDTVEKAQEFLIYAHKPNKAGSLFGDSAEIKGPPEIDTYGNPYLEYINSKGQKGKKPKELTTWFKQGGYVFFREHFDPQGFNEATWISFKAGYTTRVHKHQDDLSICLYSKGYDIFGDSGMAGFMPKDKYKDYMESMAAHSTIGIKDQPYSIANANGEKFKILKVEKNQEYDFSLAVSRVYPGVVIYRHVYYFRDRDVLVLFDEIHSGKKHSYSQYFNLGKNIKINGAEKGKTLLNIGDSGYIASIRQFLKIDELNILDGETTEPFSLVSLGFNDVAETQTLEYIQQSDSACFATVINIINSGTSKQDIDDVIIDGNEIKFNNPEMVVEIIRNEPVESTGAEIEVLGNKIIVKNIVKSENKHALYIFNNKDANIIKLPYSQSPEIECEIEKSYKELVLMYYIKNELGEMTKGILAVINKKSGRYVIGRHYEKLHTPEVISKETIKLSGNEHKFIVDLNYEFACQCSWWVYYNGAKMHYEQNTLQTFEFSFEKKGEYVVMCSFRDRYFGEFFFHQFEKINV